MTVCQCTTVVRLLDTWSIRVYFGIPGPPSYPSETGIQIDEILQDIAMIFAALGQREGIMSLRNG